MNQYKAYNRANHTVSKTRQVVMLYDGAIRFLAQAIESMEKRNFETRYHKLTRVSDILIGLQACLDFDAGGDSAKLLYDFYAAMDLRVFALHRSNDVEAAKDIIAQIKVMRDVWYNIDRAPEQPHATTPVQPDRKADPMTVSA